jgi:hypothetical protein
MFRPPLYIGLWELWLAAMVLCPLFGLGILQRTKKEQRGLRLFGVALLTLGGVLIALLIGSIIYSRTRSP